MDHQMEHSDRKELSSHPNDELLKMFWLPQEVHYFLAVRPEGRYFFCKMGPMIDLFDRVAVRVKWVNIYTKCLEASLVHSECHVNFCGRSLRHRCCHHHHHWTRSLVPNVDLWTVAGLGGMLSPLSQSESVANISFCGTLSFIFCNDVLPTLSVLTCYSSMKY